MKILVLSDTHIPIRAAQLPKKVLDTLEEVDVVFHAGDFVRTSFYEQLLCYKKVEAVHGNMDELSLCTLLPKEKKIEICRKHIVLLHGDGKKISELPSLFPYADCIIFGHTHTPYKRRVGHLLLFNPGSCTDSVFSPFLSFGFLEIKGDEIFAKIIKI